VKKHSIVVLPTDRSTVDCVIVPIVDYFIPERFNAPPGKKDITLLSLLPQWKKMKCEVKKFLFP
jgi:hypothetical protein